VRRIHVSWSAGHGLSLWADSRVEGAMVFVTGLQAIFERTFGLLQTGVSITGSTVTSGELGCIELKNSAHVLNNMVSGCSGGDGIKVGDGAVATR
jgi:hypothetical protein